MKSFNFLLVICLMCFMQGAFSQVSINTDGTAPHASAGLEVNFTNKGLLIPRVALTGTTDATTIPSPANSLLVFNTATVSDVSPGYYFWNSTTSKWVKILSFGDNINSWLLTGNAGTTDGTNFIGTTDNKPFNIRVNNQKAGRIDNTNRNAFFGYQAGNSNAAAVTSNTAIGDKALTSNTYATQNVAIGTDALYTQSYPNGSTAWATDNVAVGYQALKSNNPTSNADGYQNTAVGSQALYSNTTGKQNTAVGYMALKAQGFSQNTAVGCYALTNNTSGWNTALGFEALKSNTSGTFNVAVGSQALLNSASGSQNTAVGHIALQNNTASSNTAFGYNSLSTNTSGTFNTALGEYSLKLNGTGSNNVAVGESAGLGADGINFNQCTFVGAYSYPTVARNNVTMLGYGITNAQCTGDNQVILGNASVTGLFFGKGAMTTTTQIPNLYYDSSTGQIMRSTNTVSTTAWLLTGNAGTTDGSNFIGTTDNVPFTIKVNNQKAGRIDNTNRNAFFGYQAGNSNAAAVTSNTAIGDKALTSNTYATQNVAIGTDALYTQSYPNGSTAWATDNVAVGYQALYSNSPTQPVNGYKNIAVGSQALYSNTQGMNNTAVGTYALKNNTTGDNNVAFGYLALLDNQTGGYNSAFGNCALIKNTTSFNNAFGYYALYQNTTGQFNNAFGNNSLYSNTSGNYNNAYGNDGIYFNSTGNNNSSIGYRALYNNQSGSDNVALGHKSGEGASTINFNQCTFVGANSTPTVARTNVTMLGYGITNAQCTGNNQILLGNTSITQIRAAVGSITTYSDARMKFNIQEDVKGLDFVMRLRPVTFNKDPEALHRLWGTPDSIINKMDFRDVTQQRYIGFLAQDVEKAARECNYTFPGLDVPKSDREAYTLRYEDFIMPIVKAVQEQQTMIIQLKEENESLKKELKEIKALISNR